MRFYEVQKALDEGKKVRRTGMPVGQFMRTGIVWYPGGITHIFLYKCRIVGNKEIADRIELNSELFDDDWEIVSDAPEVTADDVLSEFKAWLEHAINSSRGTPGNGNSYLIQCMDALNYLSKSKRVQRCTPEECTVLPINNTQLVANTVSGEYVIVQLPGVKL